MKRLRLPDRLLPALILFTGLCAGLCPHARAYIISEDGDIGEFLDSLVAPVEFVDTLVPDAGNVFWLDFNDVSFNYRQYASDLIRLLPGTYTGFFDTYGNRESVRLFSTRPGQSAVLINGMPAGSGDHLGVDLHLLPLQSIMRIESAPFGAALAYGTFRPGGALNVVTRGFHHQLPFYQFTTLTQEEGLEYAGHLHFAQRIYRNLNFYMSSLLKKNAVDENEYNAIQYNLKLDGRFRNGWEGSFYSYNHTDDRNMSELSVPGPTGGVPFLIEEPVPKFTAGYSLTQLQIAGYPYAGNRSSLAYFKEKTVRNFNNLDPEITLSTIGVNMKQELHTAIPGHRLSGGLDIRHDAFNISIRDDDAGYRPDPSDTVDVVGEMSDYSVSLRITDHTLLPADVDLHAMLALNLYGYGSGLRLLPAVSAEYPLTDNSGLYAVAEKTFSNPTLYEQTGIVAPGTRYFMNTAGGDVAPEHGISLQLGWQYRAGRAFSCNTGLFTKRVTDAIFWDWPDRAMTDNDTVVYLGNRSAAEINNGLLAEARFNLWKGRVNGGLSLTQLFTTVNDNAGRIPALPATKVSYFLRGRQTLKADQLMYIGLTLNGEFVSEQQKRQWIDDDDPIPPQSFLDITLFYNILYIKTYFTVRNVFNAVDAARGETLQYGADARRFFGFPRPPMDYRFGVSLELGGIYAQEENEEFDYSGVDTDGDGIYDSDDECPETKEDFDGFRDDDGCPDSDNDRDGVPDDRDRCPNTPLSAKVDVDGCAVKKAAPRPKGPVRPAVRDVAVLDVHGGGLAPGQLPGLTGTLHKALSDAPGYTVMPLDRMHALLGDTVRAALTECTTPACIAAAAAPLAVPYTVSLVISKTGRTFTLMLQLVDSATGMPAAELTEKFMGPAAELSAGVESIAKKLIRNDR